MQGRYPAACACSGSKFPVSFLGFPRCLAMLDWQEIKILRFWWLSGLSFSKGLRQLVTLAGMRSSTGQHPECPEKPVSVYRKEATLCVASRLWGSVVWKEDLGVLNPSLASQRTR